MEKILSLAEISAIEQAYEHGVPSLGRAEAELLRRWRHRLRDTETAIRLIFLHWLSCAEPHAPTGLEAEIQKADFVLAELGGVSGLPAEGLFALGILADLRPDSMGEETAWRSRSRDFLRCAAELEPSSRLFRAWPFLVGDVTEPPLGVPLLAAEIHARFDGRGAFGAYLKRALTSRVQAGGEATLLG